MTISSRLLSIAGVAVVLASCAQPATQAPQSAATAAPAATSAPAPAAGEVTIRWRTRPGDAGEQKVYEEINKTLNSKLNSKGIKTVYDPGVNQGYFEKIQTELAADNAPDIFWVGGANTADFVASVKGNEIPAAFEQLQDVTSRPDLTPAQRATGARAMMSVAQQLQAAAANGDAKAAEALKRYQGSR